MTTETLEHVRLGMTELSVSPIAFGTWELGGEWGSFDEDKGIEAIRNARELGVNFFDTAQGYGFGASERLLGRALRDDLDNRRDEVVIATKGGLRMTDEGLVRDASPAWLRSGLDASLEALGIDYLDLYQVHWPDPNVPFAETAGALQELVDAGKIRHVGVSNFDAQQIGEFAKTRPVETLQPPYHLFRREIERDILPYCATHDIGVLVYGPLAHGLLTGALRDDTRFAAGDWRGSAPFFKGEDYRRNLAVVGELERFAAELGVSLSRLAVAWTLANGAVDVAIVGARSRAHIEDSVAAARLVLSDADLERIDRIMRDAIPIAGPSPEMMPD
ncbi:MAG TPA: aldo/keto reductase [Solirubrobacteraceae bacterium]|nr:aldo/keto reductase [Solirubrobacteraceae bacterium]